MYNRWESVAELQYYCGDLSFDYTYDLYKCRNFLSTTDAVGPVALFIKLNFETVESFVCKYAVLGNSRFSRKRGIWQQFSSKFK